jgi:hypothetical protein
MSTSNEPPVSPQQVRAAADAFVRSLYSHLDAVEARTGEEDPAVVTAYRELRQATEDYEDVLFDAYAEVPPFVVLEWTEDDEDELDLAEEADEAPHDPTAM